MNDFTTAFLFTNNSIDFDPARNSILLGWYIFLFGLAGLLLPILKEIIFAKRKVTIKASEVSNNRWPYRFGFLTLFGLLWLIGNWVSYTQDTDEYERLKTVYETQQYSVAEGVVHVLSTHPRSGDLIKIGDVEMEVQTYIVTYGYKTASLDGGLLTEGTYARVFYDYNPIRGETFEYTILRIDIRK